MPGPEVQERAVKKFGKSFHKIVWDLAHEGYSRSEAARIIGYKCPGTFLRMCRRQGWDEWFLPTKLTNGAKRSKAHLSKLRALQMRQQKLLGDK